MRENINVSIENMRVYGIVEVKTRKKNHLNHSVQGR